MSWNSPQLFLCNTLMKNKPLLWDPPPPPHVCPVKLPWVQVERSGRQRCDHKDRRSIVSADISTQVDVKSDPAAHYYISFIISVISQGIHWTFALQWLLLMWGRGDIHWAERLNTASLICHLNFLHVDFWTVWLLLCLRLLLLPFSPRCETGDTVSFCEKPFTPSRSGRKNVSRRLSEAFLSEASACDPAEPLFLRHVDACPPLTICPTQKQRVQV